MIVFLFITTILKQAFSRCSKQKKQHFCATFSHLYSRWDLNPYGHYCPLDFKSSVSTNSTTRAAYCKITVIDIFLSERRDLNPRPSPWQGDALPLSYFREIFLKERTFTVNASANLIHFYKSQRVFLSFYGRRE